MIARLDTYHKVQRHLVGLRLAAGSPLPQAKAEVLAGQDAAGWVTSAVLSPALGEPVALAYVRTQHAAPDTPLGVRSGDSTLAARVASLPLVR